MFLVMLTMVVDWKRKKVHMNNRSVPVRLACPVRIFIGGMQVESWQKQQGREEKDKNPYTPGRYRASQHHIFTLLFIAIIKKSLHSWTRFPPSSSNLESRES
jgi:hypothetical protein